MWSRVIGQDRVKQLLFQALMNNRLPHAYLFVGGEGVGKDSTALELARVMHCEKSKMEACGTCASCVKMASMQHPDVRFVVALPVGKGEKSDDPPLERLALSEIKVIQEQYKLKGENPYYRIAIPKASIIKINSIRDIRRESTLSTSGEGRRVVIISRADEMGDAAANTLLKTLEEPGGNTMFILTTSHRDMLLPTIISRCQIVQFDPLTEQDIRTALVDRIGVDVTNAALIARLANGSYTKGIELLQDDVADQRKQVVTFVRAVLGNNTVTLIDIIDELCSAKDRDVIGRFLHLLLMWMRDALVLLQGGEVINLDQQDDLQKFVSKFPEADLFAVLAQVERAISLVERNIYINLVLLQLAVQLRRNILPQTRAQYSESAET
jgi:DNA polymerase III subunit delta'